MEHDQILVFSPHQILPAHEKDQGFRVRGETRIGLELDPVLRAECGQAAIGVGRIGLLGITDDPVNLQPLLNEFPAKPEAFGAGDGEVNGPDQGLALPAMLIDQEVRSALGLAQGLAEIDTAQADGKKDDAGKQPERDDDGRPAWNLEADDDGIERKRDGRGEGKDRDDHAEIGDQAQRFVGK